MLKKAGYVMALLSLPVSALAQQPPASQASAPLSATSSFRPAYTLGPADQVVIRFPDAPEISDKPFRIDSDGNITLPLIKKFRVSGMTVEQFETELVVRLKEFFVNPQVSVTIAQYRSEPVFLVGAFRSPGIYPLSGHRTLVEMLAQVGGLQPNASKRIKITRRKEMGEIPLPNAQENVGAGTSSVEINLSALRESVNPAEDIVLQPFDVISVDRAELIYVNGEVAKVGSIEIGERDFVSVTQALTLSGGMTPSASSRIRILRPVLNTNRRAQIEVDVDKIMKGEANDFPILPNDVLYVPRGSKYLISRASAIALTLTLPVVSALAISRF